MFEPAQAIMELTLFKALGLVEVVSAGKTRPGKDTIFRNGHFQSPILTPTFLDPLGF
jgi:hypothetical protein